MQWFLIVGPLIGLELQYIDRWRITPKLFGWSKWHISWLLFYECQVSVLFPPIRLPIIMTNVGFAVFLVQRPVKSLACFATVLGIESIYSDKDRINDVKPVTLTRWQLEHSSMLAVWDVAGSGFAQAELEEELIDFCGVGERTVFDWYQLFGL